MGDPIAEEKLPIPSFINANPLFGVLYYLFDGVISISILCLIFCSFYATTS